MDIFRRLRWGRKARQVLFGSIPKVDNTQNLMKLQVLNCINEIRHNMLANNAIPVDLGKRRLRDFHAFARE
jgi:hypothetical protein